MSLFVLDLVLPCRNCGQSTPHSTRGDTCRCRTCGDTRPTPDRIAERT